MQLALDRAHGAAKHGGNLGFGQALVIPQHDHRPLTRTEGGQAAKYEISVLEDALIGAGDESIGDIGGGAFSPRGGTTPHRDVRAGEDRSGIRLQRALVADPIPGQVDLRQRGLEEVLGIGLVPRQQVCRAHQHGRTRTNEAGELRIPDPSPSSRRVTEKDAASRLKGCTRGPGSFPTPAEARGHE